MLNSFPGAYFRPIWASEAREGARRLAKTTSTSVQTSPPTPNKTPKVLWYRLFLHSGVGGGGRVRDRVRRMGGILDQDTCNMAHERFPFKRLLDFKIQQKSKTNKKCKKNDGIDHNFNIGLSIFNIKNSNNISLF